MIIPRFKRRVMPRNDRFGRFRALRATYRYCIHYGCSLRELRRRSLSPFIGRYLLKSLRQIEHRFALTIRQVFLIRRGY